MKPEDLLKEKKSFAIVLLITLIATTTNTTAQEKRDSLDYKFVPIVQIFNNVDINLSKNDDQLFRDLIGRAHLGFQFYFQDNISAKIIVDRGLPTTVGQINVTDLSGKSLQVSNTYSEGSFNTMTLKFAFIDYKYSDKLDVQVGSILQQHYIQQENFWGLRYLAETFMDRYYGIPSADLGFILYIKPTSNFSFDFALTNGEGFRKDQDKTGKVQLVTGISYNNSKEFQARIMYHHKAAINDNDPSRNLVSAFAGYKFNSQFRLGLEGNYFNSHKNISGNNFYGISIYGIESLNEKLELLVRYDRLNGELNNTNNINSIITGLSYNLSKYVRASLNYQSRFYEVGNSMQHVIFSTEFRI